jgi:hypothetical protein
MKMDFYYVNICKHEHEKIWCKIVFKIVVEMIKGSEGPYFNLFPLGT